MTELSPRERRFQKTQQAILDAAREIINKQGVEALSMRAIADKIDYSAAGLYEYYAGKEEIVLALCEQGLQRFVYFLKAVDQTLPAESYMLEMGVAYIQFALQNSDFFLLMFTTAPRILAKADAPNAQPISDEQWRKDDAFGILVAGIERCVAEGLFHPQPNFGVMEMARTTWSMVHGIAMLLISVWQQVPFSQSEETMRTMLRIFFAGMKSL